MSISSRHPRVRGGVVGGLIVMLAVGCSVPLRLPLTKQTYVPTNDPDKALVYIYRESGFAGSARGMYVTMDGTRIGGLNTGTYFVYEASPGPHMFAVEDRLGKNPGRALTIEPGRRYYLRADLKMGFWDAQPQLMIRHDAEGQAAIAELQYATLK